MARGRPATPLGTYGKISVREIKENNFEASTRLRLPNGTTKRVRARGTSKNKATNALKTKCQEIAETQSTDTLTPTSTVEALLKEWLEDHDVIQRTHDEYEQFIARHLKKRIGLVRLNELTTPLIQTLLNDLSPANARTARAILSSSIGTAVRWGLMAQNPVRETKLPRRAAHEVQELSEAEILEYRKAIRKWHGGNTTGINRGNGIPELVDVLIGTGVRIGEALALRWEDVDLNNGTISVSATVDNKSGRADGPKTTTSRRTIRVTPLALKALKEQRRNTDGDIVFPSRNGKFRTVNNVERQLREARPKKLAHITPHSFRRNAATRIERTFGVEAASHHLGHASTKVTESAYVAKHKVVPDYSSAFSINVPKDKGK